MTNKNRNIINILGQSPNLSAQNNQNTTIQNTSAQNKSARNLSIHDEILGSDGYFLIQDDDDLPRIIRQGLADRGRHMAIAARHFLKSRRSHERCTDSLITLYRKVIAK